jgi:hypothetical protein
MKYTSLLEFLCYSSTVTFIVSCAILVSLISLDIISKGVCSPSPQKQCSSKAESLKDDQYSHQNSSLQEFRMI